MKIKKNNAYRKDLKHKQSLSWCYSDNSDKINSNKTA